ncbi:FecR domain-containing protein [uncultured Proteiniphilum sp.]|uniref:FecR family protein n=1 Tax=uncultured Proteiniphilum sp. TaxID=497637 RepID=UPI002612E200|nr:FecR domain-containing protein [uncultured Proteiniphilum sp.]
MKEKKENLRDTLSAQEKAAITRDLFERYRKGNTTREENDIIESLEKEVIPEKEFEVTGDLIQELDSETKDFVFKQTDVKIEGAKPTAKKRTLSPAVIGSVAGVVLLLIGMFVFYQKRYQQASFTPDLITASASRQYVSGKSIEHVTLPDGSQLSLNAGTTLSLHEGSVEGTTREIWLDEGEVFFDVKEDKAKPFTVHLREGLTVQVLGTSFTIQSYKELPFQEISVLSGKVKVETSGGENIELIPDQKATYRESEKILTREKVNSAGRSAWRTGTIVLENASLDELRFRVRQFYGKEMIFEHNPEIMSVNITFNRDTSPGEISTEIAALYHLSYRITADQIIFFPKDS